MRFGTMLTDVLSSLFRRPATERYPAEKQPAPTRLRGTLQFVDPATCTGCALCVKDCPANAIEVITIDKASKRFVLRYHVDRCTFCAQCVQSCRHDSLALSNTDWELAASSRDAFIHYYGKEADVAAALADRSRSAAGEPAKK